jgi:predicted  nucleic acid-binding Zn-ribbon protein
LLTNASSGLPEVSPSAEDLLEDTERAAPAEDRVGERVENDSVTSQEVFYQEKQAPEGLNDARSAREKHSDEDWLEAEMDKISEQIARIHEYTANIPTMIERGTELEQAYEIVARNTQNLNDRLAQVDIRAREMQETLETLNKRNIKHEGETHILKNQCTQLGKCLNDLLFH